MPRKITKDKSKGTEGLFNEENVPGSDFEEESAAGLTGAGNIDSTENIENPSNTDIMKAIRTFKKGFHTEMGGALTAIKMFNLMLRNAVAP